MAGEINFGLVDQGAAAKGAARTNAMLQQFAKVRAGQALASGAPDAAEQAQAALNQSGDLEGAGAVEKQHWSEQAHIKALDVAKQAESAKFTAETTAALYQHLQQHKKDDDGGVAAVLAGFDQLMPIMQSRGATAENIAMFKSSLAKDPAGFLTMMHNEAASHLKRTVLKPGDRLVDDAGTELTHSDPKVEYKIVKDGDGTEHLVAVGGPAPVAGSGAAAASGAIPEPAPVAPHSPINPDDVFGAVVQQESHGKPGVTGPMTQYGQAHGETQMLDKTAEAVAKKIGVAWEPGRMTGTSAEDEAYQLKLGRAYFQEGLDKYQGDVPKALAYYFGGPDERQWGPKTRKYVTDVLSRLEPTQTADASGGVGARTTPAQASVPVGELFKGSPKPVDKWTTTTAKEGDAHFRPGTTYEVNSRTGQTRKLQDPEPKGKGNGGAQLPPSEEKTLYDLRKQADELRNVTGSVDRFLQLNKDVPTGAKYGAGMGNVVGAFNKKVGEMVSITSKLTPAMRNGLPGAASDKDVAMFKSSTVSVDKPFGTNQNIGQGIKALARRVGDHTAFVEAYALQHGTLKGSTEVWNDYVNSHPLFAGEDKNGMLVMNKVTPWRQAIPMDGDAAPKSGTGRTRNYDVATGAFH